MKRVAAIFALLIAPIALAAGGDAAVQRIAGPDGPWDYASIDQERHRLLVARGDGVMAIDLRSGAVTPRFVPGERVHQALALPDTGLGLSTNGTTNDATLFDAATGAVKARIPTGKKPDAAIWDAKSKRVYVMNAGDGSVSIVDPMAARVTGTVPIGGALEYAALGPDGHVHVNVEDRAELVTFDPAEGKVLRRVALAGCADPSGLALTRQGTLIAACANGVAKAIDAASGRTLADLKIGQRPDAVIYDARRERAYIPSGGDGTLTEIDTSTATPKVSRAILTQRGARTGTVDPASGRLYLPAAELVPAADGGRPSIKPGSFAVLVVTP